MIKLKDEISGGITMEGRISKPLTEQDRWRLNHASNLCRKILVQAGCRADSIFVGPLRGTHPSGTVRIGELIDQDLQTEIRNLYVSDASSFPEALDRPTVLTLIALSKRLARHLTGPEKPKGREKVRRVRQTATEKEKAAAREEPPASEEPGTPSDEV
jgi:choline dehydrogenase-like flavoprotein